MALRALPGRNDPCPCGSGKKFKKCCLGREKGHTSGRDPLEWFHAEGIRRILDHYAGLFGDELFDRLEEDWGYGLRPDDPAALEICLEVWMIFCGTGWRAAAGVPSSRGRTIAEDVVREFPTLIDREMREWLGRVVGTSWSFYVVASNPPGGPCEIENLMTGERSRLADVEVAAGLFEGEVFYAAMLPREGGDASRLFNLYPWTHGSEAVDSVRTLRERISRGRGFLSARQLERAQDTLRLHYFVLHLERGGESLEIHDLRDGEEVVKIERLYALSVIPRLAFDALEDLARPVQDHDELLEDAFYDEKGRLENVQVPWYRSKRDSDDERDFRLVARFHIGSGLLAVSAMSERLARNAYEMVRRRLGDSVVLVQTERSESQGPYQPAELDEPDMLSPTLLRMLGERPLHPLSLTFHAMAVELSEEGRTPDERFLYVLQDLSVRNPEDTPGAAEIFGGLGIALSAAGWSQGVDAHVLLQTLERAARTPSPEAAWLLRAIGSTPGYGLLGEKARALAGRLAQSGVEPRPLAGAAVSEAVVSAVDGAGCRALVARTREADQQGPASREQVLDVALRTRHRTGFELATILEPGALDLVERMRGEQSATVTCSATMARELVADGLARTEAAGTRVPPPFLFAAALLHETPIEARARTPDLGAYDDSLSGPVADLLVLESAEELIDSELFGVFWPHEDELYGKLSKRGLAQSLLAGKDPPKRLISDVIESFLETHREELAHGLACNLEFAAMTGRHDELVSRAAYAAWRSLADESRPLRDEPFVRFLANRGIYNVANNLAQGVRSVAEAERFW